MAHQVWREWELKKVGDICLKHQVLIVSDEIHSDFVYPGYKHHVFASLSPEYADCTVTCTAPSKTFNLAGLQISNIFISNPALKKRFRQAISETGYDEVNLLGMTACQAAYEEGEEWLAQLKEYLAGNLAFVREYLKQNLPQIRLVEPEGTYLLWLDFRELGLSGEEREKLIVEKAHLWLDRGEMFGSEGTGFERVNIACPKVTLRRALEQLSEAVSV